MGRGRSEAENVRAALIRLIRLPFPSLAEGSLSLCVQALGQGSSPYMCVLGWLARPDVHYIDLSLGDLGGKSIVGPNPRPAYRVRN